MAESDAIHLYWATGCTSCLRVKEHLERNDVSFVSHNILNGEGATDGDDDSPFGVDGADPAIMQDMADMGLPSHVPVVRKGTAWADGKDIGAVSELLEIEYEAELLPVDELYDRLDLMLEATLRHLADLPESELETNIPNRPRTYADLIRHVFSLSDVFILHEAGVPMDNVPRMEHDWDHLSTVALSTYGSSVRGRLADWISGPGQTCNWEEEANVFWGQPTKHEFFERTTWHTGQHVRQLEWVLTNEVGTEISDPIDPAVYEGLPLPEKVWNRG